MDKLVASANAYFDLVEGIPFKVLLRSTAVKTLLVVTTALIVSFTCYLYLKVYKQQQSPIDWLFLLIIVLEIATFKALGVANLRRKQLRLERAADYFGTKFDSMAKAKRHALKHFFGKNEADYLAFAKEISQASELNESLRVGKELDLRALLRLVYDPDSKPRIYALLLVIVSGITALSIKSGANIDAVWVLMPTSWMDAGLGVLTLSLVIGVVMFGLYLIRVVIVITCRSLAMRMERKTTGELAIRCLQRDLLKYHRFLLLRAS